MLGLGVAMALMSMLGPAVRVGASGDATATPLLEAMACVPAHERPGQRAGV